MLWNVKYFPYDNDFHSVCLGVQIRGGGLRSASGYGPRGSIFASGFRPGGPNLGGGPKLLGNQHCVVFLGMTLDSHSA